MFVTWIVIILTQTLRKYVEVRRPVRLDYDGPMWSVMNINAGNQTLKIPLFVTERRTTNKLSISSVVAINLDVTRGDDHHASSFFECAFFIKTRRTRPNKGHCKKCLWIKCFEQIAMFWPSVHFNFFLHWRCKNVKRYVTCAHTCTVASGWQIL